MNQRILPRGRVLIAAVFATLAPLATASAGTNPEEGAFYTLDRDLGSAPGAKGPIRTDDPPGAWHAGNLELGSFYHAQDSDQVRGAKAPIRTDNPSGIVARAGNPELGSFYRTQDFGGAPAARLGGTQDAMRTGDSSN
jgi:hypothetical protein